MQGTDMNRRRFLRTTGLAAAAAAGGVGAASVGAVVIEPRRAWALATTVLDGHQARTLLAMARQLFPHDELGDGYYAAAVEALDEQAAEDPELATQLADGVAALDAAMGIRFVDLSEGNQLRVLEAIDDSAFFGTVRGATLAGVYGNETVQRRFGYEGSSVEHGGYIERGFDDLGWLPDA